MYIFERHLYVALLIALATVALPHRAAAQTILGGAPSLAFKSGETAELGELYWVVNCRSILKGVPEATILEGPPGVTVQVVEAQVMARRQRCAKPVAGGKLILSVKDVEDASVSQLTIRFTFRSRDGSRRQNSQTYNLSLFP